MIKLFILAPRRAGMTHDEFRLYLTENHWPLIRSVPEVAGDMRHYHYNFPVVGASDTAFGHPVADHLDVVTQIWFESVETMRENLRRPRYVEIVRPDEGRFADEERVLMQLTKEWPALRGERTPYRVFYFRRRSPGLSRERFQQRWLRTMREIFSEERRPAGMAGYLQNQALSEAEHSNGTDPKYFDVIDEFFFEEPGALARLSTDRALVSAVRRLEDELLDTARTRVFIGETVINIP